jgi:hypothetical protein
MIRYRFKIVEHCVVNTLDFKIFKWIAFIPEPIFLSCWKARLNKLVIESDEFVVFTIPCKYLYYKCD